MKTRVLGIEYSHNDGPEYTIEFSVLTDLTFKRNNGKRKVNEIKFESCKHISTSKTAYKLIQQ